MPVELRCRSLTDSSTPTSGAVFQGCYAPRGGAASPSRGQSGGSCTIGWRHGDRAMATVERGIAHVLGNRHAASSHAGVTPALETGWMGPPGPASIEPW